MKFPLTYSVRSTEGETPGICIDTDLEPFKNEGLRVGLFGGPGSGKSYRAAATWVEPFLEQGGTVVIIEPRAEYHTLKVKYPDVQVIGGPYLADVPFSTSHPKLYADAVVQQGISMIFYTGGQDEEKVVAFAEKFIGYLLTLEETYHRPIMLVLEEAQEYVPAKLKGHAVPPWTLAKMVKQFTDCSRQGRKLGISPIAISQRPQEVDYTVRQLCNVTFYGKFAPQDLTYIDKECLKPFREKGMDVNAKDLLDLPVGSWLTIIGAKAAYINATVKRQTPHGADTPSLDSVPPPSAEVHAAVSSLSESLKAMLEKEEAEGSVVEKLTDKVRELEREKEAMAEQVKLAGNLKALFRDEKPGSAAAVAVAEDIRKMKEQLDQAEQDKGALEYQLEEKTKQMDGPDGLVERLHRFQEENAILTAKAQAADKVIAAITDVLEPRLQAMTASFNDRFERELTAIRNRPVRVERVSMPVASASVPAQAPKVYQVFLEKMPKRSAQALRYILDNHPREVTVSEAAMKVGVQVSTFRHNQLAELRKVPGFKEHGGRMSITPL